MTLTFPLRDPRLKCSFTENWKKKKLSWCQLCLHWWYQWRQCCHHDNSQFSVFWSVSAISVTYRKPSVCVSRSEHHWRCVLVLSLIRSQLYCVLWSLRYRLNLWKNGCDLPACGTWGHSLDIHDVAAYVQYISWYAQHFVVVCFCYVCYTLLHRRWSGVYWIHPDIRTSFHPPVCTFVNEVSRTFWKNVCSINFIPGGMGCISWPLFTNMPVDTTQMWKISTKLTAPQTPWHACFSMLTHWLINCQNFSF